MARLFQTGNSLAITLPASVVKIKRWTKGTEFAVGIDPRSGRVFLVEGGPL